MDITGYRSHQLQPHRRATLDTLQRSSHRPLAAQPKTPAPRLDTVLVERANHPRQRHPRVRLGRPTSHESYIHWQDYLDIADTHVAPKISSQTHAPVQLEHQETISEMLDRYRQSAQVVSDKLSLWLRGAYGSALEPEIIPPGQLLN